MDNEKDRELLIEHRLTKIETELSELNKNINNLRSDIKQQIVENTAYANKISKTALYISISSFSLVVSIIAYLILH